MCRYIGPNFVAGASPRRICGESSVLTYADLASAVFAFGAAGFWIASAMVKAPVDLSAIKILTVSTGSGEFPGSEQLGDGFVVSDELATLGRALALQSWLSRIAAICAAFAALCQAAAAVAAHFATLAQ